MRTPEENRKFAQKAFDEVEKALKRSLSKVKRETTRGPDALVFELDGEEFMVIIDGPLSVYE